MELTFRLSLFISSSETSVLEMKIYFQLTVQPQKTVGNPDCIRVFDTVIEISIHSYKVLNIFVEALCEK